MKQKEFKLENIDKIRMETIHVRTCMNLIATLIGVIGIILVKVVEEWGMTILWIEIVVLPSIYLIGNAYIEEKIKKDYQEAISEIEKESTDLNEAYIGACMENNDLKNKIRNLKRK